jgi:hypothetical protein
MDEQRHLRAKLLSEGQNVPASGLGCLLWVNLGSDSPRHVRFPARHAVLAIYEFREFATAGGLISYGASILAVYRQIGIYAGKMPQGCLAR